VTDHISVIFTNVLDAATDIQVAMCRVAPGHPAQEYLDGAMQSLLTAAEECRQAQEEARARMRVAMSSEAP